MAQQDNKTKAMTRGNPKSRVHELSVFIEKRRPEIMKILPEGLSVERVIKTAIMAAMENEEIGKRCTAVSIYRSVVQASLMGLTVGSGFNEGYFIRYGESCTFRASYLGWSKVAQRSEGVDIIRASVVYANDHFSMSEHPPSVEHKPAQGKRGEIVGAIAVAYTMPGHQLFDFSFVSPEELKKARSQNQNSSAWKNWPDEMRKKVAIRRLCKMLPRNEELNRLQRIENNADQGVVDVPDPDIDNVQEMVVDARFEETEPEIVNTPPAQSRTQDLKEQMGKQQTPPPEDPDYGTPPGEMDF